MAMTIRRRYFMMAGAGGLAATALAACDSPGGGSSSGDELQMVESLTSPDRTALLRSLLDQFEKENEGITVKLVSPPTEQADQKIQQMLQAGSGIDVLEVRDLTVGPFSNNGWLYDMTKETKA